MLEKKTYKILKCFYRKKRLSYKQIGIMTKCNEKTSQSEYISCLRKNHFIDSWESTDFIEVGGLKEHIELGLQITLDGSAYIEQRRRDACLFWVPYSITTFIALLSLLGTVFSNAEKFLILVPHFLG